MSVSSLELALLFTMMIYDGCVRNWILEKAGGGEGRAKKRNELSHIFSSQSSFRAFIQIGHRTVVGTGDGDRPDPD